MSARLRFRTLGLAALAAATALSMVSVSSDTGLVAQTEAAYTDSEHAKADVTAKWPTAFTSVVAGSAKSATTSENATNNMTYESSYRWTQRTSGNAMLTHEQSFPNSPRKWSQTFDQTFRGTASPVEGNATTLENPTGGVDNGRGNDPRDMSIHNWGAVRNFEEPGTRTPPTASPCLAISGTYSNAPPSDTRCGIQQNIAAASNTTTAYGFSTAINNAYIVFLNSADLTTSVKCSLNSSSASSPSGRVDIGLERGATNPYLGYNGLDSGRTWTIWADKPPYHGNESPPFPLSSGEMSDFLLAAPTIVRSTHFKAMPIITKSAVGSDTLPPHAVSEVAIYLEVWDRDLLGRFTLKAKMYFVLSRSECGVRRTTDAALPTQRTVFPATLPGGNGLTSYTGSGFSPATAASGRMALQATPETTTLTSLPPATTVTSPLESATATVTTTSAPPNPSDEDEATNSDTTTSQSPTSTTRTTTATTRVPTTAPSVTSTPPATQTTTTTSAISAPSIPDEPGDLSATAETEEVGTVEVDGEEVVVVVEGDNVPIDAGSGTRALDTWINDRRQPSENWTTFTSDDPDEDGWRWAAINQTTGTIVYIR